MFMKCMLSTTFLLMVPLKHNMLIVLSPLSCFLKVILKDRWFASCFSKLFNEFQKTSRTYGSANHKKINTFVQLYYYCVYIHISFPPQTKNISKNHSPKFRCSESNLSFSPVFVNLLPRVFLGGRIRGQGHRGLWHAILWTKALAGAHPRTSLYSTSLVAHRKIVHPSWDPPQRATKN